jgi:hypothetical protein
VFLVELSHSIHGTMNFQFPLFDAVICEEAT